MPLGSTDPLHILPFDHRHSYLNGMFEFKPPPVASQRAKASGAHFETRVDISTNASVAEAA